MHARTAVRYGRLMGVVTSAHQAQAYTRSAIALIIPGLVLGTEMSTPQSPITQEHVRVDIVKRRRLARTILIGSSV